ncbi:hypothetical protein [Neolewinella xylanilytica]|uniref:hypothetical protein n=1 Tax=Neolewinella xylanilytica TaxID=1514080 RepID=UPI000CEB0FBC|nr:hypothetical protein [Neolewinella xylanilytica]
MEVKIACPKCDWEPDGRPYWTCDACGTRFDTFETTAICPNCTKGFEETQCVECTEFSPHLEWYRNLDGWLREQLEKIRERVLTAAGKD